MTYMQENDERVLRIANIEDVGDRQKEYYKKYRIAIWSFLLLLVVGVSGLVLFSSLSMDVSFQNSRLGDPSGHLGQALWYVLLLPAIGLFWFSFVVSDIRDQFMQSVAEAIEFTYSYEASMDTLSAGILFTFGHSQRIFNILSGMYQDIPMRMYNYETKLQSGKEQEVRQFTVCEFTFPYKLPHILLGYKHAWPLGMDFWAAIPNNIELELEGDFGKYFKVSTEKGFETEALQVLTPDVMAALIDLKQKINFETKAQKLYVFRSDIISSKDAMIMFYQSATELTDKLAPHFKEVSMSVKAMER